jgi:DNA-binding transcriptional LysR family regulator
LNTTQAHNFLHDCGIRGAFGVRLLDRSSQGIEATEYDRALLRRSAAAFDELKQSGRDTDFLSNPEAAELRIGGGSAIAEGIVLGRAVRRE